MPEIQKPSAKMKHMRGNRNEKEPQDELTVVVFLVGVGHFFEDGHDLFIGGSVLDGISHSDGHSITW